MSYGIENIKKIVHFTHYFKIILSGNHLCEGMSTTLYRSYYINKISVDIGTKYVLFNNDNIRTIKFILFNLTE